MITMLVRNQNELFQSTLLMKGATIKDKLAKSILEFQSTLLMKGATLYL